MAFKKSQQMLNDFKKARKGLKKVEVCVLFKSTWHPQGKETIIVYS
jgi:hypothetical protein